MKFITFIFKNGFVFYISILLTMCAVVANIQFYREGNFRVGLGRRFGTEVLSGPVSIVCLVAINLVAAYSLWVLFKVIKSYEDCE